VLPDSADRWKSVSRAF